MTEPTRVLLHGYTGCAESWVEVIDELPTATPVLTLDLFGHEITRAENMPEHVVHVDGSLAETLETFEDEVDRLARVLRSRKLTGCHLVGYSMGGRAALGLLVRYPELFVRGTLIGAHAGLETDEERRERAAADEEWARLLEHEGLETFFDLWRQQPLFASQYAAPESALCRQAQLRARHDPQRLAVAMRRLGLSAMPNYRARLRQLELPIDLIVGGLDTKFSAIAREMAEILPAATLYLLGGVGHNALLESPRMVAAVIASQTEVKRA